MIIFDQETRQFSVVEETREFARYRVGGRLLPFRIENDPDRPVVDTIRTLQGKGTSKQMDKENKRLHKQRMAMIKRGMDPSALQSDEELHRQYKLERQANRNKYRSSKRDQKFDHEMQRFNAGADQTYRMAKLNPKND